MAGSGSDPVTIRVAEPADRVAVDRVLDGALLDVTDAGDRIAVGTVLVATVDRGGDAGVVGAAVLAPEGPDEQPDGDRPPADWLDATHVRSIGVRRRHRRRGIGTALLDAAVRRWGALVVDFEPAAAEFYDALGADRCGSGGERQWALVSDGEVD